jgi:hypothetical protein
MTPYRFLVAALIACGLNVACGSKPEPAKSGSAGPAAETKTVAEGAKDMASGLAALGKGIEEMAKSADTKPVEPVNFHELQAAFPDLPGWTKSKPTGEKMSSPVSFSQAEVKYTKGPSTIEVKIVDSGFNQIMMAPFAMFLTAGYEKETENGYEKSVRIGEYPGLEKWDSASKDGELTAVVGKRFLIEIEGRQLDDPAVLRDVAQKTNMGQLAAIK